MAKQAFGLFEWKIENFSYWCEAVHGKFIKSPDFFYGSVVNVKLYPRGTSGEDDHMAVHFLQVASVFNGELSFIGLDGSLICSQEVNIPQTGESVSGPVLRLKFEEVLDNIRKADSKDEITLQLRIQNDDSYEQRMSTTINVLKLSYEIDPKLIENCVKPNDALYFRYSSMKGNGINLKMTRHDEKIKLIMKPYNTAKNYVLVESCICILSGDESLYGNEITKRVFVDEEEWILSESLKIKDILEKDVTIHLSLKVINGERVETYNHVVYDEKVKIVLNSSSVSFSEVKSTTSLASSNQGDDSVTVLTKELMYLLQDQDFSDFQIRCDDISFPVHKAILSARSPVFKSMLSSDMIETTSGRVDIGDLDPSTLTRFLSFIYTGALGEEDLQGKNALYLYYAADKYQVPSLKKECFNFLCANISLSTVCDILSLADKHKDDDLITVARNFIVDNYNDVLATREWERFAEVEPVLAIKTLTYFAQKKYVKKA